MTADSPIRPVLIAHVGLPQPVLGGDPYYRAHAPSMAMAEYPGVYTLQVENLHRLRKPIFDLADVLVLPNVAELDMLPWIEERRARKQITIFEINDDITDVPKASPAHQSFNGEESRLLHHRMARSADALQYSVAELERKYGFLNPVGEVFVNHFVPTLPRAEARGDKGLTIGWGGSDGHLEDMRSVAPTLCAWLRARADVRIAVMGSPAIYALFQALPEHQRRWVPGGDIHDYYGFLQGIDIGIAPLLDTPYNRSRSDVKFVEYAGFGVTPVVQNLVPYKTSVRHGETGFLFEGAEALIATLDRLCSDQDLRRRIANQAYDYVARERRMEQHASERLDFYERQLKAARHVAKSASDLAGLADALSKAPGAKTQGRCVTLGRTDYEKEIYDGLPAVNRAESRGQAMKNFERAAQLAPEEYLPYLLVSTIVDDPRAAANHALTLNPKSLQAHVILAKDHERRGELAAAAERYLAATHVFPAFEQGYLQAARLARAAGSRADADALEARGSELLQQLRP